MTAFFPMSKAAGLDRIRKVADECCHRERGGSVSDRRTIHLSENDRELLREIASAVDRVANSLEKLITGLREAAMAQATGESEADG